MKLPWITKEKGPEQLETEEGGSRKRNLEGIWGKYVYVVGAVMAVFHIWALAISPIAHWNLYCLHILFGVLLVFPLYKASRKSTSKSIPWYDFVLMGAGVFAFSYCLKEAKGMAYRMGSAATMMDLIAIGIIIVLLLE